MLDLPDPSKAVLEEVPPADLKPYLRNQEGVAGPNGETLLGAAVATGPAVWGVSPHLPGTGLGALRFALTHLVPPGRPARFIHGSRKKSPGSGGCPAMVEEAGRVAVRPR